MLAQNSPKAKEIIILKAAHRLYNGERGIKEQ